MQYKGKNVLEMAQDYGILGSSLSLIEKKYTTMLLGDDEINPIDYWYIGMDLLFIDRADFNFEKGTVKLYSSAFGI